MFRTGYEVFVRRLEELEEGKELQQEIRDAQTYERKNVKALVSPSPDKLPDGQPLWVRGMLGRLLDEKPWRIKKIGSATEKGIVRLKSSRREGGLNGRSEIGILV